MRTHRPRTDEPSPADLAAIEAEQPLIAAELALLDAEIALLAADERGGPSPLDWRRLRRAEARVIREAVTHDTGRRAASRARPASA